MTRQSARGVTLIELMVTVSIAVIMMTVAAPSFQSFVRSTQLRTAANDLAVVLVFARSEAIKRGWPVTVCKSSTTQAAAPACNAAATWQQGWLVFVDLNQNGSLDAGETALRVGAPESTTLTITSTPAFAANYLTFHSNGFPLGSGGANAGTFTVCSAPQSRVLTVSKTGRSQISTGSCT